MRKSSDESSTVSTGKRLVPDAHTLAGSWGVERGSHAVLLSLGDLGDPDENVEQLCWGTGGLGDEKIGLMVGAGEAAAEGGQAPPSIVQAKHNSKGIDNDDQEPLALLVVHAAMHMLFLPQFTCDFYEDASLNKSSRKRVDEPSKDDRDLLAEAGLREKTVDWGVSLEPTPASIVWAPELE